MEQADGGYPCPVCGRTVFSEAFEICPICGWENSGDESIPEMAGGANGLSFNDYCIEYRRKIAADLKRRAFFGSSIEKICKTMSRISFAFPSTPSAFRAF